MIAVTYHDDLNEVQGDPALAGLLNAPSATAPFDRIDWWRGLQQDCGLHPLIVIARHGDERAVLPLQRQGNNLAALANWYSFRVAPLCSERADKGRLFAAIARDIARKTTRISLAPLGNENGQTDDLATAFRATGWLCFRRQCDVNHVLAVQGRTFAEYLATRPGQLRTTLRRKAGKIEVRIETTFNPQSWAAYEEIYAQSWKPEEGSPAFLRHFAEAEAAAGRLRLGLALADGRPIAAQLWTVEHRTAFIHKLAHIEAQKALSPGSVLTAALFEQVVDKDGVETVDFGTGNDPYKRDWMEQVRPRYALELYRPGWPANWPRIARAALRAMRAPG